MDNQNNNKDDDDDKGIRNKEKAESKTLSDALR